MFVSKKRRRKRDRRPNVPVEVSGASVSTKVEPSPQSLPSKGDFNPDYTYVFKDLKRIAVLAGTFIAVLIILSFFLR
jgi:hypothetical protein